MSSGETGPRYLSAEEAAALDRSLFSSYGFALEQLMELAGLSVATAVAREFPAPRSVRTLVVCGAGNNGGDGLVAARHLREFGHDVCVWYVPGRRAARDPHPALLQQAIGAGVRLLEESGNEEEEATRLVREGAVAVDALCGFGFRAPARTSLLPALRVLAASEYVASVDVPSGWRVDEGPPHADADEWPAVSPRMLVSLSAPKLCARRSLLPAGCKHYLGGRFVPPALAEELKLSLPAYPGEEQAMLLH